MSYSSTDAVYVGNLLATTAIPKGALVKLGAAGYVALATIITDQVIGVADEVGVIGQPIRIQIRGIAKVLAGAAGFQLGEKVANTVTTGLGKVSVAASYPVGLALETAASGTFGAVLLNPSILPQAA